MEPVFQIAAQFDNASRSKGGRDARLPEPGSVLQREFKGQMVMVQVLPEGFQYQDRFYKSLSAIARQVTGTAWNGFDFFRLPLKGSTQEGS
jgi:Protein of unknown function (DUF2924)